MTKFDKAINHALAKKIAKAKKKTNRRDGKVTAPNTPGNYPASQYSPALRKGAGQDIADSGSALGT